MLKSIRSWKNKRKHAMPKILMVDDDDVLRRIYSRYLKEEGFEVLEASNGEQALLEFSKQKFDVILLDIRMPISNGQMLIPALQQFHPHAKIIVSSCYDLDFQKEMIGDAEDYFNKSEGCRALVSRIRHVLSEPRDKQSGERIKIHRSVEGRALTVQKLRD